MRRPQRLIAAAIILMSGFTIADPIGKSGDGAAGAEVSGV